MQEEPLGTEPIAGEPLEADLGDYTSLVVRETPYLDAEQAVRLLSEYTPPDHLKEQSNVVAQVLNHGLAAVSFNIGKVGFDADLGPWKRLQLVYSPAGFPTTNLDGERLITLLRPQALTWRSLFHDPPPGVWAYYTLFAKYESGNEWKWVEIGRTDLLMPTNYNYSQRLYTKLPEWYQRVDQPEGGGLLRDFMSGVGFASDINRSWAQTGEWMWNPRLMSSRLLPYFGESIGLPYEAASGDKRFRKLAANALTLRKWKGTERGLAGYLAAMSGYRCLVYDGPNLLYSYDTEDQHVIEPWTTIHVFSELSRVGIDQEATGAPQTDTHAYRLLSNHVAIEVGMRFGDGTPGTLIAIAPGTSRQVRLGWHGVTSNGTFDGQWFVREYDVHGDQIGTDQSMGTESVTTTWTRFLTLDVTLDDDTVFIDLVFESGATDDGVWVDLAQLMLVDTRWRPTALPGRAGVEPLSDELADPSSYAHPEYYEPPRTVWVNVYPQRINFALNSNFELDNLPAGAWSASEESTYRTLPIAYGDYAAVAAGETDYEDLASEFDSLTDPTTVSFDTVNKRMVLEPVEAPWICTVRAAAFPVIPGQTYSAALEMGSSVNGTSVVLSIHWQTAEGFETVMLNQDGSQQGRRSSEIDLNVGVGGQKQRVEVRNAVAPEGASYARFTIQTFNDVDRDDYVYNALIENNAIPGGYFDGTEENGGPQDFLFADEDHQSYSMYYMNYEALLGCPNTARMRTVMKDLVPPSLHVKMVTCTELYGS